MVTNTVNSDTLTTIDHRIERQLDFFGSQLKTYEEYFRRAIENSFFCLLVPKFVGFETGEQAWRYDERWYKVSSEEEKNDWKVIRNEVLDAKTI